MGDENIIKSLRHEVVLLERRIVELEADLEASHQHRLDLKRARLKDWAYAIGTVLCSFTVCGVFTVVIVFHCYAQIQSVSFELNEPLMWFLFIMLGTLIGVNAKEMISSLARIETEKTK
jgi:hypothetical protein